MGFACGFKTRGQREQQRRIGIGRSRRCGDSDGKFCGKEFILSDLQPAFAIGRQRRQQRCRLARGGHKDRNGTAIARTEVNNNERFMT
ncbi:MAG: hypothetical protein WDN48_04840 [Pseudolabrys sp.]